MDHRTSARVIFRRAVLFPGAGEPEIFGEPSRQRPFLRSMATLRLWSRDRISKLYADVLPAQLPGSGVGPALTPIPLVRRAGWSLRVRFLAGRVDALLAYTTALSIRHSPFLVFPLSIPRAILNEALS